METKEQIAKAKKAAYDKARREAKKSGNMAGRPVQEIPVKSQAKKTEKVVRTQTGDAPKVQKVVTEKTVKSEKTPAVVVSKTFDKPVRLFWNRRFEEKNSSCAKPGVELNFEEIENGEYRVRRGKRNFFTNTEELEKSGVSL